MNRAGRSLQGRISAKRGDAGEHIARVQLGLLGVGMVDEIHTGWRIVRWVNRQKNIAHVVPYKKVSADISGILPDGRRVLAEVKTFDEDRLQFGRLKKHQHERLAENIQWRGLSLVAWVRYGQIIIMDYDAMLRHGFKKGTSIHYEETQPLEWAGWSKQ